jgi:cyclomaltodextrinase / maltogenic alpha-amylase / neopullulanase
MKVKTFLCILCSFFYVIANAQTVPVTIYRDARHSPYQTVITYEGAVLNDDDGDREFEVTLDLEPGIFEYGYWTDNSLAVDPDNPRQRNGAGFSILTVSDPMITYLLPKDGGMMAENRIRADLAYTAANPPLAGTMSLLINGSAVSNPESYFDATKRRLLLPNPPSLVDGENTVTFSYETNAGEISRSSTFSYHPIVLNRDMRTYRMEQILVRGRVMDTPYPASVFVQCDGSVYEAGVNAEGYFGTEVSITNGNNPVKVAYSNDGFDSPVDEMSLEADLRHSWWVELTGSLDAGTATVSAVVHGIDAAELSFSWSESADKPEVLGISGSASSVSFSQPATEGEYQVELQVTATDGTVYTARTIFLQDDDPHFLGLHERAPWMEEMVLYETEDDYYTWGCYSFTKMKEVLPHMKKLGLNALMLPPFNAGGYVTHDHFQLNTGFGTKEDLIGLVDAAHALGIRVIFDVALGHSNNDNPFLRSSYYVPGNSEPYDDFYEWSYDSGSMEPEYSEQGRSIVHINLGSTYVQEYVIKLMEFWMEEFGIDGYRYDSGQESIERAPEFMSTLLRRLKNIKPDCWIMIEGDDRDHPGFSFYDYGDSGYDWKLNSEWGDGGQGLPGVYKGMYTLDQLDGLLDRGITTASPKKGLLMNYANVDYHDYFHNRYGWEQEKAALSLVFTTYGLPMLFQGEEVGAERAGGHFDYDDPMGMMPFYSRLIKARKYMLGNYPEVSRITLSNSDNIYAYTAWRDTSMTLTVINFSDQAQTATVTLDDAAFQGKVSQFWSEITDLDTRSFSGDGSTDVALEAFESKIFLINTPFDQVFPPLGSIQLISQTGESSISEDGGSLQLEVVMDPECSIEELEWVLEGDTHLASISNGLLQTCGCGDGLVTVTVRSKSNPTLSDHMDIAISAQSYGQILNPGFENDMTEWRLFGNEECNSQAESVNGEAHITLDPHEGGDCGVSMGIVNYLNLQQGRTYRLSFDARSSSDNFLYAKIWKSEDGWAQFFWNQFEITTTMQHYSTEFTREEADTKMGQLLFDFTGNGDEYWIDNVSFCEVTGEEEEEDPQITFRVDMRNETVSGEGVYVIGDWDPNNQWATPLQMSATGSVYSMTVGIAAGKSIQYKFKNGQDWENPTGDCLADDSDNRFFTVGTDDETLPLVCYNSCEACAGTGLDLSAALAALVLYPNPTKDVLCLDGLPDQQVELRVYDMLGRLVFHEETPASPRMEVDMSSFPNGIYALSVWSPEEQESHTFRVVKE